MYEHSACKRAQFNPFLSFFLLYCCTDISILAILSYRQKQNKKNTQGSYQYYDFICVFHAWTFSLSPQECGSLLPPTQIKLYEPPLEILFHARTDRKYLNIGSKSANFILTSVFCHFRREYIIWNIKIINF